MTVLVASARANADTLTAYEGFLYRPVEGARVTSSTWDINHVSGGVALAVGGTELTLGMGYAWGGRAVQRDIPPTGDLPPIVQPREIDYTRMKFIIGIAL